MKGHISADSQNKLIHPVIVTIANAHKRLAAYSMVISVEFMMARLT